MKATAVFVYVCAAAIGLATILGAAIVDEPLWARVFVGLVGLVMCPFLILLGRAYSKAAQPTAAPLSPQQVMRNTRAQLPTECREWFDWTADIAGFDIKHPKSQVLIDPTQWSMSGIRKQSGVGVPVDRNRVRTELRNSRGQVISVTYHDDKPSAQPKPKLPTEYRTCPDRTCNISYGPGAGWTHTDQHTWVEMQT